MHWDDLRYLLAVCRRGGHVAAGRALGVAATTVGRRIAALERDLGASLFRRTPAGLVPTDAGARLRGHAERVEAEVLASQRELAGDERTATGAVRLTSGDGIAVHVLAAQLPELRRRHPQLQLELRADNRVFDLSRREADIALRAFRPTERALVIRRLTAFAFGLYAGEPYLARRGRPRTTRELPHHDWLLHDPAQDRTSHERWRRRHAGGAPIAMRASTTTLVMAACASGLGLALLPEMLAVRDPRLVAVPVRGAPMPSTDLWLAIHRDVRTSARVNAVVAWLVDALA